MTELSKVIIGQMNLKGDRTEVVVAPDGSPLVIDKKAKLPETVRQQDKILTAKRINPASVRKHIGAQRGKKGPAPENTR